MPVASSHAFLLRFPKESFGHRCIWHPDATRRCLSMSVELSPFASPILQHWLWRTGSRRARMRLAGSGEGRGREGGEDCLGSQKPTTQGGEGARGRGGERGREGERRGSTAGRV